jgi:pimeloyl-ACP methyl ester carboxylesterase
MLLWRDPLGWLDDHHRDQSEPEQSAHRAGDADKAIGDNRGQFRRCLIVAARRGCLGEPSEPRPVNEDAHDEEQHEEHIGFDEPLRREVEPNASGRREAKDDADQHDYEAGCLQRAGDSHRRSDGSNVERLRNCAHVDADTGGKTKRDEHRHDMQDDPNSHEHKRSKRECESPRGALSQDDRTNREKAGVVQSGMKNFAFSVCAVLLALIVLPAQASATVPTRTVAPSETFAAGILQVERFGSDGRPPVIIIPALFCGSWQWNGQIAALSPSHTVFVVTLPGFDGRPTIRGDALMTRAAQSIDELIRKRRLVRPVLVGHSLGGTLAVYFGERYPSEIGGIVSAEGGYPIAPKQAERDSAVEASVRPYVGIDRRSFENVLRSSMLRYVITSKEDVATIAPLATRSDPAALVAWMRAALTLDLTPQLLAIRVPFTEIVPFDSTIDPYRGFPSLDAKRRAYTTWISHARDGKVIMIDHSRHFVMFDQPQVYTGALVDQVSRMSGL